MSDKNEFNNTNFNKNFANAYITTAKVRAVYPETNTISYTDYQTFTGSAVVVSNIFTQYLGLSGVHFPEPESEVVILRIGNSNTAQNNFVIGSIPTTGGVVGKELSGTSYVGVDKSLENYQGLASDKRGEIDAKGPNRSSGKYPANLVDGESTLTSATGAGIEFLYNLCKLKGSELATVEAYVLDDLVRILSKNYEHISSFGDFKIINSGAGLNVLWQGTSNEYEALGNNNPDEPLDGYEMGNADNLNVESDPSKNKEAFYWDAKWRFTSYIGKIGNFIHTFITDPGKNLDPEGKEKKAGRFKFHVNQDGSFILQSISDIVFEKVVRIPVPIAKDRIDLISSATEQNIDAYEVWTPLEGEDLYETSYKFADYAKWLSNYYALAGFYRQVGLFNIPESEAVSEEPDVYCKDQDFQDMNGGGDYINTFEQTLESYATIRIFKDGSIVLYDAYGSAIHMTAGNVNISASKSINLTAASNIVLTSGRDVIINAKNNIELSALTKGILMKAKTWLEALCSKGAIVLESALNRNQDAGDDFEYADRLAKAKGSGIILTTNRSVGDATKRGADITFKTTGSIISDSTYFVNKAIYVLFTLGSGAGQFVISKIANFSRDFITFLSARIKAFYVNAKSVTTNKKKPINVLGTEYLNAVDYSDNADDFPTFNSPDFRSKNNSDSAAVSMLNTYSANSNQIPVSESKFSYRDQTLYNTNVNIGEDKLFQPLTYQSLANNTDNYKVYNFASMTTDLANIGSPYPGTDAVVNTYKPTVKDLNKPCTVANKDLIDSNKNITTESYKIYSYEPSTYIE